MSNNMLGVTALKRHASNLFYNVPNFQPKYSATPKVLITVQKYLFKLVLKSIPKYPEVSNI